MKLRALIAEDEPLLAQGLKTALALAWPELDVVHLSPNGLDAIEQIMALRPAVAFLDIRMPGLTGLEVAAELADRLGAGDTPPAIVFVTAYDEFALKAFDLAAVDYLLKPVAVERLARTVERLKIRLASPTDTDALVARLRAVLDAGIPAGAGQHDTLRHIQAGSGNTVRIIALEEVCYFQASDKYTTVAVREDGKTAGAGQEWLLRMSLKELLDRLPRERFRQVHRGTIVNLDEVAAAVRDDAGRVTLRLKHRGNTLAVSRVYAEMFRQM